MPSPSTTTSSSSSDANNAAVDVVYDAVIVGGGPCGLALALALQKRGQSVAVIERDTKAGDATRADWSKAYLYRFDDRGVRLFERIGVMEEIKKNSIPVRGFRGRVWNVDGTIAERVRDRGGVGYWIPRVQLVNMLKRILLASNAEDAAKHDGGDRAVSAGNAATSCPPVSFVYDGRVDDVTFEDGIATTRVIPDSMQGNNIDTSFVNVRSRMVVGCDGMHSIVRSVLCKSYGDSLFGLNYVPCPSEGLIFKAMLIDCADMPFERSDTVVVRGTSGRAFYMQLQTGEGTKRPLSAVRHDDFYLYRCQSVEEAYQLLEKEFPQLPVRKCISEDSLAEWISNKGSVFPRPQWAGKAATVVEGVPVAVVGDALHAIPPDLGQGVNAGFVDIDRLLDALELIWAKPDEEINHEQEKSNVEQILKSFSDERVTEAQALCSLVPIGFPYQYYLPHSVHKLRFYVGFMTRVVLFQVFDFPFKLLGLENRLFYPPAIYHFTQPGLLSYGEVLRRHKWNTGIITTIVGGVVYQIYRFLFV